ncbi:MAG: proline--tRNA ligase [Spirochaetota bacterium]
MRYSRLVTNTTRECPRSVRSVGNALLQRAGYIRPLSQGLYSFLPLGARVLERLERLIRREMLKLEGQEVLLPLVNPLELWKRSGRADLIGREMIRFRDASGKQMVLAPTHEEAMVELVKSVVTSYRQLPVFLFQFQTKYRNESRPRAGLIRTREFVMKDGYSFHRSQTELNIFFPRVFAAYRRVFEACRVPVITAEAAVGMMLGDRSFEFLMPSAVGDDRVIRCSSCGYAANQEVAVGTMDRVAESPREFATVETGDAATMAAVARALDCGRDRLAKTMVYSTGDSIVLAVVRGDQEVSVERLARSLTCSDLRLADPDELTFLGLDPASIGPIDVPLDVLEIDVNVRVIVDEVVANTPNLVVASNETGRHFVNVNFGRDFESELVRDISRVIPGARCRHCGGELLEENVVELGNIFKLGDYYSRKLRLSLTDSRGHRFYPSVGAYGIGLGRLMAAVAEANNDRRGLDWPRELAPYTFFLMGIGRSAKVAAVVEQLHDDLGDEVLHDDRRESISTKFKDADLMGIPYRIIVSRRTLEAGQVELLERGSTTVRRIELPHVRDVAAELGRTLAGGGV